MGTNIFNFKINLLQSIIFLLIITIIQPIIFILVINKINALDLSENSNHSLLLLLILLIPELIAMFLVFILIYRELALAYELNMKAIKSYEENKKNAINKDRFDIEMKNRNKTELYNKALEFIKYSSSLASDPNLKNSIDKDFNNKLISMLNDHLQVFVEKVEIDNKATNKN
jgi:hypothetical protein